VPLLIRPFEPNVGLVLSVIVSDPFSFRRDEESPRSESVTMLIDSGASDSSIAGAVADRLSLPVLGLHTVSGFGARGATLQYLADMMLRLDGDYELSDWKLLRFDSQYDKIQGILGRDILERARFVLDGPNRQFTLEIPV
jgi:hypothetical protein